MTIANSQYVECWVCWLVYVCYVTHFLSLDKTLLLSLVELALSFHAVLVDPKSRYYFFLEGKAVVFMIQTWPIRYYMYRQKT